MLKYLYTTPLYDGVYWQYFNVDILEIFNNALFNDSAEELHEKRQLPSFARYGLVARWP